MHKQADTQEKVPLSYRSRLTQLYGQRINVGHSSFQRRPNIRPRNQVRASPTAMDLINVLHLTLQLRTLNCANGTKWHASDRVIQPSNRASFAGNDREPSVRPL
jgi:hypothetical protein